MSKNLFQVVMPVADYGLGYNYIKYLLDNADKGPVTFEVSSLGGDLNQAKQVKKLFADHGDITLDFFGYCASATTVLGHGIPVENTRIYSDAWFMIHQPLVWVEEWGRMNADDLTTAIENLKAQKEGAELQTLQMAKEYADYTGQPVEKMLSIMKEEKWLTAQQAVDLGLVGKVIPSVKGKKSAITNELKEMIAACALPPIPESSSDEEQEFSRFQKFYNRITNNQKNQKIEMRKDFSLINQVLAVEGVNESNGQITMSVEHVMALNNKIKADADSISSITAERDTAVNEKATAENALTGLTAKIDELDPTVKAAATTEAKVAAITAKLASRPGAKVEKPHGKGSETSVENSVEWGDIDSLPHNQAADKEIC